MDRTRRPAAIAYKARGWDDRESRRWVTTGPFLGTAAKDRPQPSEDFDGDHKEFLRAYRTAFVYWLREKGADGKKPSHRAFAELLTSLAGTPDANALESILSKVYEERPLSTSELSTDDLEGAFLTWLSKQ